jgi:hypothetical protein
VSTYFVPVFSARVSFAWLGINAVVVDASCGLSDMLGQAWCVLRQAQHEALSQCHEDFTLS